MLESDHPGSNSVVHITCEPLIKLFLSLNFLFSNMGLTVMSTLRAVVGITEANAEKADTAMSSIVAAVVFYKIRS